jgi:hypothetical protein
VRETPAAPGPALTVRTADVFLCSGGCQLLSITGAGFRGSAFSCLFKRGAQRVTASATRVDGGRVTCTVPPWHYATGSVQLILVKEDYGPIAFQGPDPAAQMFEFLAEWRPVATDPYRGPASGGTRVAFRTYGFTTEWSWYRCVFRRPHGMHALCSSLASPTRRSSLARL